MKIVAALHLSFRSLENIELRKWIRMASFAPSPPTLLSPRGLQDAMAEQVLIARQMIMNRLPANGLISTALDCWQSPNKYSFMAITGYVLIILNILTAANELLDISLTLIGNMSKSFSDLSIFKVYTMVKILPIAFLRPLKKQTFQKNEFFQSQATMLETMVNLSNV